MVSCAFSSYFTHTVFPLCVHPATIQLKWCWKTVCETSTPVDGAVWIIHEHCQHGASCWVFVRILLHKCHTRKPCYLYQSQLENNQRSRRDYLQVIPTFYALLPCCGVSLGLFLVPHCFSLFLPCSFSAPVAPPCYQLLHSCSSLLLVPRSCSFSAPLCSLFPVASFLLLLALSFSFPALCSSLLQVGLPLLLCSSQLLPAPSAPPLLLLLSCSIFASPDHHCSFSLLLFLYFPCMNVYFQ